MAYQFHPVSGMTGAQASGQPDYMKALQQGFQGAADVYKPRKAAEDLLAQALQNKMRKPYADTAQQWYESALRKNNSGSGLTEEQAYKLAQENEQNRMFNEALANGGNYRGASNNAPVVGNSPINIPRSSPENTPPNMPPLAPDNSNNPNVSYDGPGVAASTSTRDTFPGRSGGAPKYAQNLNAESNQNEMPGMKKEIANEGDQSKEYLNRMYDQHPEWRAGLKKNGYEKTQDVKFDPKTGISSIITKYPNGRVEVSHTEQTDDGFSAPTPAVKTANQGIISAADNVLPVIKSLKKLKTPNAFFGKAFQAGINAKYEGKAGQAIDQLMTALKLPSVVESIHIVEKMVTRRSGETDDEYHGRLDNLMDDVISRRNYANTVNTRGFSTKNIDYPVRGPKTVDGKTYHLINGEWLE